LKPSLRRGFLRLGVSPCQRIHGADKVLHERRCCAA